MSGIIEVIKPWSSIIAIVVLFGIAGQMESNDAAMLTNIVLSNNQ